MKKYAMAACLFMAALNVCAQTKEKDSLRVIDLQEVEIISTRATGTTPVAFTNINKDQLKKHRHITIMEHFILTTSIHISNIEV